MSYTCASCESPLIVPDTRAQSVPLQESKGGQPRVVICPKCGALNTIMVKP